MHQEKKTELVRKSIHLLIALSIPLAALHRSAALILLFAGTAFYALMEGLRYSGVQVPLVSPLTAVAMRERDRGRFVLGPVTLGLGAFLPILLFPPQAAAAAVYTLAFGDGLSSLAGRFFGRLRPPFLFGKSVEGSCVCLAAALLSCYLATGRMSAACAGALTATVVEVFPLRDYDNLAIPLASGFVVQLVL
jgi:dolichol kinase